MMDPLSSRIARSFDLQERTRNLYVECVRDFVVFAGSDPSRWTCGTVEAWLSRLLTVGRTQTARKHQKPCSPRTVQVYRKAIRYASRQYAKDQNDRRLDFAENVNKVKARTAAPREPLTYEEADRILATCSSPSLTDLRDHALLVTAFRTGLRRGGLLALTVEGIRPPKITTVNKGGDPITFDADKETIEVLQEWIEILRRHGIRQGPVFRHIRGGELVEPMTPFQVWSVFNRRAKKAGVRHVFPHLARHSTVTWLREAGKSAAQVSKLTGQTERTIENIYTHVRLDEAVADALPSLRRRR